jgi:dCMP deaminase
MKSKWIEYFKAEAMNAAFMSKDNRTKVGAVVFDEEEKVSISSGWNDLPRGVEHTSERNSAPLKYKMISHAEISAITNAARMGRATLGKSIYVTMFPCSLCAAAIINAGIKKVYSPSPDFSHAKYGEDFKISMTMFQEAGVEVWKHEEQEI